MANPYIGEIRMFGGNFAIYGWAFCDGSLLPISQYSALFQLVGTTYGGDGQNTFALPDLRGRIPIHQGQGSGLSNYVIGQPGGAETVTVTVNQLAAHSHNNARGSVQAAASSNPANNSWGNANAVAANSFGTAMPDGTMNTGSIGMTGGNQPHDNMLPFLPVSFIIALEGIYPSQ